MRDIRKFCRTFVKATNSGKFKSCQYYGWNPMNMTMGTWFCRPTFCPQKCPPSVLSTVLLRHLDNPICNSSFTQKASKEYTVQQMFLDREAVYAQPLLEIPSICVRAVGLRSWWLKAGYGPNSLQSMQWCSVPPSSGAKSWVMAFQPGLEGPASLPCSFHPKMQQILACEHLLGWFSSFVNF